MVAFRAGNRNGNLSNAYAQTTVPATAVVGDLLVAVIRLDSSVPNVVTAVPSGWVLIASDTSQSTQVVYVYKKVCTSGDIGATQTWTTSAARSGNATILAFSSAIDVRTVSIHYNNLSTFHFVNDIGAMYTADAYVNVMTAINNNVTFGGQSPAFDSAGRGVGGDAINGSTIIFVKDSPNPGTSYGAVQYGSLGSNQTGHGIAFTVRSNTAPTQPVITAPNGGEVVTNSVNVTWTASTDVDGDAPVYDVDYTRDNGATWTNLVTGTSATAYLWNTSAVAASSACRVRVRAHDPYGATTAYDESNANFTIQHNQAPNPATWASPANNSTLDRSVNQVLTFNFLDPDAGDVLTKFDYRYRLVGAGTWTTTGTQVGATPSLTIAGGTLAAGTYEIQVLTYDGQGVAATGWSASLQFTMADPPGGPVVTAPASGGTVSSNTGVAAWTIGSQTGYQVQQVADNAGVMADPSVPANIYSDTGQVTGSAAVTARNAAQTYPVNNRYQWTRVRIQSGGVWSAWSSVRYQVAYTPPAAVTVGVAAPPSIVDALQVTVTLTPPAGSQPVVTAIEVWRQRITDSAGGAVSEAAVRVANVAPTVGGTVITDYGVRSGHGYQYQAIAIGANTTVTRSPWIT